MIIVKTTIFVSLFFITQIFANEKVYSVAFPSQDFFPQYQLNDANKAVGLLPDILEKFSKDTNIKFQYKFLPVKRYMEYFKNNQIDFLIPSNPLWSLDYKKGLNVVYSEPIITSIVGILVAKEHENINRAELKKLGTISGYTINGFDSELANKKLKISYSNDPEALLKKVLLKRVQGAYFHIDIAKYYIEKESMPLVIAKNLPLIKYEYHMSTHQHPEVIKKFNQWLSQNKLWLDKKRNYRSFFKVNPIKYVSN